MDHRIHMHGNEVTAGNEAWMNIPLPTLPAGAVYFDGSNHYTYDAENRVANVNSGATGAYVYDAAGNRVRKTSSAGTVDYIYDLSGHVISEMGPSAAWNRGEVYAGGMHVATYDNGTTYFTHSDWLGTERVRTSVGGTVSSTWTSMPFGEGSAAPNPGPTHFTGKERDTESGLDYFGARYYASSNCMIGLHRAGVDRAALFGLHPLTMVPNYFAYLLSTNADSQHGEKVTSRIVPDSIKPVQ